jgi:hypothetical protein
VILLVLGLVLIALPFGQRYGFVQDDVGAGLTALVPAAMRPVPVAELAAELDRTVESEGRVLAEMRTTLGLVADRLALPKLPETPPQQPAGADAAEPPPATGAPMPLVPDPRQADLKAALQRLDAELTALETARDKLAQRLQALSGAEPAAGTER